MSRTIYEFSIFFTLYAIFHPSVKAYLYYYNKVIEELKIQYYQAYSANGICQITGNAYILKGFPKFCF